MDQAVTARIDHLLRTDPRLTAAAPLIGRIPAIVTEPKPPRARRKKGGKKLPPPRPGEDVVEQSRDEDEEEQVRPSAPWLKVVKVKKVPPDLREALGAQALAMAVVDGWLWGQLDAATKDDALTWALRGLVWEEKEDGSDLVRSEKPPLQTWPDCVVAFANVVAALTENPSEAADLSNAVESMGTDLGKPSMVVLLRHELNDHERRLAEAETEFSEYDNSETLRHIEVLEGQVALLRKLLGASPSEFVHDEGEEPEEGEDPQNNDGEGDNE